MKRFLSLLLIICLFSLSAAPLCCAATADQSETLPAPELDKGFDVNLAMTLILICCAVLTAVILVLCVIMAKRNFRN